MPGLARLLATFSPTPGIGGLAQRRSGAVAPVPLVSWLGAPPGSVLVGDDQGHVAYESRPELARMLLADFERQISWIVAQPFLVEVVVAGQVRCHVPDIALTVTAIEGSCVTFRSQRGRAWRPTLAGSSPTPRRSWGPAQFRVQNDRDVPP